MKNGPDRTDRSIDGLLALYPRTVARFREVLRDIEAERREFPLLLGLIGSRLHGIDHWARVGTLSLAIAASLRDLGRVKDPALAAPCGLEDAVLLAAFFHDCSRSTEATEPGHGAAGERVWRSWAARKEMDTGIRAAVSQAILFHEGHRPAVDPAAGPVAVCLANADRLDRVRLGDAVRPHLLYDDGVWPDLLPLAEKLLGALGPSRVRGDLRDLIDFS
jgi:hypothetical protein